MPTAQRILDNVKLYRNSFSDQQIVDWMNTVQQQIYQDVPHEALPFTFVTIADFSFYPLPLDCDPLGVKQISIETKAGSGRYRTLDFISIESNQQLSENDEFYSIQGNENIFLNPLPTLTTEGRTVCVIYNKRPAELSTTALTASPDLEEDFHELIELGAKARVARERGEVVDKNNFESDFNALFRKYQQRYKLAYPEYPRTKDVMPSIRRGGRGGRRSSVSGLIPGGW